MIETRSMTLLVRALGCLVILAAFAKPASAQAQTQQYQLPQTQAQTSQSQPPTAAQLSLLSQVGYLAPGYYPTTQRPWPDSGAISLGGTRPIPPGYRINEAGERVFCPPPGAPCYPYSRSCGCVSQNLAGWAQEKASFGLYIRGYGPAIHTRPASICW